MVGIERTDTPVDGAIAAAPVVAVPAPTVYRPTPGSQITSLTTNNTFTFGDWIGEGFFGTVYACTDVWNNSLAVKILKPLLPNDALRESAEHELGMLRELRHPNITFVHDAFEFQSSYFIVTERCEYSLDAVLRTKTPNGMLWLIPVARCLLQAVHYLHVNGYAHQDIHPANVMAAYLKDEMMPSRPEAVHFKLSDLGVAKLAHELTVTDLRKRSIMPPEVLEPETYGPLDQRIDIYHLGLLLLQLAYSRPLEFTVDEILAGRPREMALALSAPYSIALEKALRRRVIYRTATAMELFRDLHSAACS
jgi:serine/threonine-protein kinase